MEHAATLDLDDFEHPELQDRLDRARRRIAIARAYMRDDQVMILDEPTAALECARPRPLVAGGCPPADGAVAGRFLRGAASG